MPKLPANASKSNLEKYLSVKLKPNVNFKKYGKSSLAVLAPFAAMSLVPNTLQAQCNVGNFDPSGGSYSDGQLDVNGDTAPDFDFDLYTTASGGVFLFMTVVGSMQAALYTFTTGGNGIVPFNSGASIAATAVTAATNFTWLTGGYDNVLVGNLTTNPASSVFIPIKDASGAMGFINIVTDGAGGFTVDMSLTGIENASGGSDGFGVITTGNCNTLDGPLPVSLKSFTAEASKDYNTIYWSTASEINNEGFELQRSTDGQQFNKTTWILGAGTTVEEQNYFFKDRNVQSNIDYYYRLKQIDLNGRVDYSEVIKVRFDDRNEIKIEKLFPNPSRNLAQLNIISGKETRAIAQIYNQVGQLIKSQNFDLMIGQNNLQFNLEHLSTGNYYLKLIVDEKTNYQNLVVQSDRP